ICPHVVPPLRRASSRPNVTGPTISARTRTMAMTYSDVLKAGVDCEDASSVGVPTMSFPPPVCWLPSGFTSWPFWSYDGAVVGNVAPPEPPGALLAPPGVVGPGALLLWLPFGVGVPPLDGFW